MARKDKALQNIRKSKIKGIRKALDPYSDYSLIKQLNEMEERGYLK